MVRLDDRVAGDWRDDVDPSPRDGVEIDPRAGVVRETAIANGTDSSLRRENSLQQLVALSHVVRLQLLVVLRGR